ncbi:MAG: bifunctional riboflavin kinase/FAD synthetase [Bacteroidota bacterium]
MKIFNSLDGFNSSKPVLTIGTFDGVHIGHQKILFRLKEIADEINGEVTLLTFHPHPRLVLYPSQNDLQLLTTQNEKAALLKKYGVNNLVFMPFTHEFSRLSYEEFVKQVIVEGINAHVVVIGYDHHFGHNREGGLKQLQLLSKIYSFRVEEIPEQDIDYAAVSSTRVRKALLAGDVASANQLLGHAYSITGKVIHGNHIGRELGFPTANLLVEEHKLIPSNGIYAVKVFVDEEEFNGMLSIGTRPTFDNGNRSVEVNILDFNRDIYDKEITIELLHYLREEVRFNGKEELIEQMKKDKLLTMELLS